MIQQDSTQVTFSQVYNDFKGALQGASDALKTGSEHVYEILVRQQVTMSIVHIVISVFLLIALVIVSRFCLKSYKKREKNMDSRSLYIEGPTAYADVIVPMILTIILFVLFVVHFIGTIDNTVTGFTNPEYGAIMEIKNFIR